MTTRVKGIYNKGIIKPLTSINLPNEYPVDIYFIIPTKDPKDNFEAFKKTAGVLPNLPTNFSKKIREDAEKRLTQKWLE